MCLIFKYPRHIIFPTKSIRTEQKVLRMSTLLICTTRVSGQLNFLLPQLKVVSQTLLYVKILNAKSILLLLYMQNHKIIIEDP